MIRDSDGTRARQMGVGLKTPLFFLLLTLYSGSYSIGRILPVASEVQIKYFLIIPTVFTTLLATASIRRTVQRAEDQTLLFLFSAFVLLSLASVFWLKANPYTVASLMDLIWVFVFSVIAYILGGRINDDEIRFTAKVIVLIGSVFMIAGFLSDPTGQGRISAFGGGPNVYVRIVLLAFMFAIFLYLREKRTIYLLLSPPLLIAALLSGSRGGVVALVGTVVFLMLLYFARPKQLSRLLLIGAGASLATFLYLYFNPATWAWVGSRFVDTLFGEDVYTSGRDSLYEQGLDVFQNNPLLGIGVSGFAGLVDGGYPHNIFIEVAVSTGIIGLSFLLLILFYALGSFLCNWNYDLNVLIFFLGFVFVTIASQFSGSFFDTRFAWVFVFFSLGIMGPGRNFDSRATSRLSRKQLK